jgi:hypothetical protein
MESHRRILFETASHRQAPLLQHGWIAGIYNKKWSFVSVFAIKNLNSYPYPVPINYKWNLIQNIGLFRVGIKKPTQKNPPKKTKKKPPKKKPLKLGFLGFLKFFIFFENNTNFSLSIWFLWTNK